MFLYVFRFIDFKAKIDFFPIFLSPSVQQFNVGYGDYGTEEYRMNRITDYVENLLKQEGYTVYRNDKEDTLKQVVQKSNDVNPAIHVSIHSNASGSPGAQGRGPEIYVRTKGSNADKLAGFIYDNLLDFINLLTNNGEFPDRYRPTNVATVKNNNIEILNFNLYRQAQGHQNRTFDDYLRTLAHEFVHACHMEILIDKTKQPALLMEGIATQLSKQTMYQIDYIDCSAQDLTQNFYKTHKAYHYAYTIMGYLLATKTHDEILSILKTPHKINVNNLINAIIRLCDF